MSDASTAYTFDSDRKSDYGMKKINLFSSPSAKPYRSDGFKNLNNILDDISEDED